MSKKSGVISSKQFTIVGWLSIALGIIAVPYTVVVLFAAFTSSGEVAFNPIATTLSAVYTIAYVYLLFFIKKFLNVEFNFHKANRIISLLIFLEVLFFLLGEVSVFIAEASYIIVALLTVFGILTIMLGIKLLDLKEDLFGLLKPFAYNIIAMGVLMASIILIFFALIPMVASQVILGIIFLRYASK